MKAAASATKVPRLKSPPMLRQPMPAQIRRNHPVLRPQRFAIEEKLEHVAAGRVASR
jgi:hypothetical protein